MRRQRSVNGASIVFYVTTSNFRPPSLLSSSLAYRRARIKYAQDHNNHSNTRLDHALAATPPLRLCSFLLSRISLGLDYSPHRLPMSARFPGKPTYVCITDPTTITASRSSHLLDRQWYDLAAPDPPLSHGGCLGFEAAQQGHQASLSAGRSQRGEMRRNHTRPANRNRCEWLLFAVREVVTGLSGSPEKPRSENAF